MSENKSTCLPKFAMTAHIGLLITFVVYTAILPSGKFPVKGCEKELDGKLFGVAAGMFIAQSIIDMIHQFMTIIMKRNIDNSDALKVLAFIGTILGLAYIVLTSIVIDQYYNMSEQCTDAFNADEWHPLRVMIILMVIKYAMFLIVLLLTCCLAYKIITKMASQ